MRRRTSLIVSHRISAVRDADLICVLAGAESGVDAEELLALLAVRGSYSANCGGGISRELDRLQREVDRSIET